MKDEKLNKPNLVFDMDGTLYRLEDKSDGCLIDAAVTAALAFGFEGGKDKALDIAARSLKDHGYPMQGFSFANPIPQHQLEDLFLYNVSCKELEPSHQLKALLKASDKTLGVLTHSTTAHAKRVLRHLQLIDSFDPAHIVGIEAYDHEYKHISNRGYNHVLGKMGVEARDCIFVEDNAANLKIAHAIGMTTVLVHARQPHSEKKPAYVDYEFKTIEDLMQKLAELRKNRTRQARPAIRPRNAEPFAALADESSSARRY